MTVEWASKTKENVLHEGLESLGKMLCRGTYKQIAGAVWRNPILKKHVQQLFLREVDRECTALCSLKNPSCMRSPTKKDLQTFSFKTFSNELESRAPLLSAVLWTASLRKSKRQDEFWAPAVCMSAAVLLKNRSPCMNAIQLLNTIILYHTGIIVSSIALLFIHLRKLFTRFSYNTTSYSWAINRIFINPFQSEFIGKIYSSRGTKE